MDNPYPRGPGRPRKRLLTPTEAIESHRMGGGLGLGRGKNLLKGADKDMVLARDLMTDNVELSPEIRDMAALNNLKVELEQELTTVATKLPTINLELPGGPNT